MSQTLSGTDIASHNTVDTGLWVIIDDNVYDLTTTDFINEHPGGAKILKRVGGKDASRQFWKYHNESVLKKYSERLLIGQTAEKAKL